LNKIDNISPFIGLKVESIYRVGQAILYHSIGLSVLHMDPKGLRSAPLGLETVSVTVRVPIMKI